MHSTKIDGLNRRSFLAGSGAAVLLARYSSAATADPIGEYDQQGIHRTGTTVDRASAEWLAGLVGTCGLKPALEGFRVSRVDPQQCFAEAGGRRVEGVPMFDGSFTGASGVRGRIGPAGGSTPIGWLELAPNGEAQEILELRKSGRHQAMVVVTKGGAPGLCLINAPNFRQPIGPPVLQVASENAGWLRELSASGAELVVTAPVQRTEVDAFNVTAVRKGKNAKLAPLVVMTPRSGWWHCASERGGGIVCWLEVMRGVRQPARDLIFTANSGHELGHQGLSAFIEKRSSLVKDAHAWIHFGANIGAAKGPPATFQCNDEAMRTIALEEIEKAGQMVKPRPLGAVPNGEAGNIHRGGGRYISLIGGNDLFHNPLDRWPDAVNPAAVDQFARAFTATAMALAG